MGAGQDILLPVDRDSSAPTKLQAQGLSVFVTGVTFPLPREFALLLSLCVSLDEVDSHVSQDPPFSLFLAIMYKSLLPSTWCT